MNDLRRLEVSGARTSTKNNDRQTATKTDVVGSTKIIAKVFQLTFDLLKTRLVASYHSVLRDSSHCAYCQACAYKCRSGELLAKCYVFLLYGL